jgi:hypothetical protein
VQALTQWLHPVAPSEALIVLYQVGKTLFCFAKTLSVFQNTFCFYLLGLFIRTGEKLFQGNIQKSFLVIVEYKKIWNCANFLLLRPQYCPPFYF